MVGWHHRLNGHECEQAPGDGEGQGSPVGCSPGGRTETVWVRHNKGSLTERKQDKRQPILAEVSRADYWWYVVTLMKRGRFKWAWGHDEFSLKVKMTIWNPSSFFKFSFIFGCGQAFSSCGKWGYSPVAPCFLLTVCGSSCWGVWALGTQASVVNSCNSWALEWGLVVAVHGLSCPSMCGIFLDQELNLSAWYWQADSQPLNHQRSPNPGFLPSRQAVWDRIYGR